MIAGAKGKTKRKGKRRKELAAEDKEELAAEDKEELAAENKEELAAEDKEELEARSTSATEIETTPDWNSVNLHLTLRTCFFAPPSEVCS